MTTPTTDPDELLFGVAARTETDDKPDAEWVRGTCPECGGPLVANFQHIGGRGYLYLYECWGALAEIPTCTYRRVL